MSNCPVVVVGASAGGVQALSRLVEGLPADFPAAVCIVLHMPAHSPSRLHEILGRLSRLPVSVARDNDPIRAGTIVVAPTDRHLMVDEGVLRVTRGPKESRVRPAVDVLFRSAAAAYGSRVIGIVLSGMLDDGTAGLWSIKDRGGIAIVQDPLTAEFPGMPSSAISHVAVDRVVPIGDLATELMQQVNAMPLPDELPPVPESMRVENLIAREGNGLQAGSLDLGERSKYTCPECHGALVQIREGKIVRFRCHTGHAYSLRSLLADVSDAIDSGLWDTLRAVEERILLLRQLEEMARLDNVLVEAEAAAGHAAKAEERVEALRAMLLDGAMFGSVPES